MEWLTDLFGVGASVASGGIFGLLGSLGGMFVKVYQEKQRQEWEQRKWDQEVRMQELNLRAQSEKAEQDVILANTAGSWRGLESSQNFASTVGQTHMWVNDAKSLFRPILTISLWVLSWWVFKETHKQIITDPYIKYMIESIYFSASTATVWWFGDRAFAPPGRKNT